MFNVNLSNDACSGADRNVTKRSRFINDPGSHGVGPTGIRRLATVDQTADFLGVTARSVRNYISRGLFPAYRIPGTRGVRLDLNEVNRRLRLVPATVARPGLSSFGPNATIIDLPRMSAGATHRLEDTPAGRASDQSETETKS